MKYLLHLIALTMFLSLQVAQGQSGRLDNIRLFQTFFEDAAIARTTYGEGLFRYNSFDNFNSTEFGASVGFPLQPEFELGAGLYFLNFDPDRGTGESGIRDIPIYGKYHLQSRRTQISTGAFLTLPIGNEDVGQGNTDFGVFGSLRHPLAPSTALTGTLGIYSEEFGDDRETSLLVAGGLVHQANDQLALIGELNIKTAGDFALLSGGIDLLLSPNGRLRGALGFGLDNGAPDLLLHVGYLAFF